MTYYVPFSTENFSKSCGELGSLHVCESESEFERESLPEGEREFMQQKNDMESGVCLPFYTHTRRTRGKAGPSVFLSLQCD